MTPRRIRHPRPRRPLTALSGLTALALMLTACGGGETGQQEGDGKIQVTASTNVWASVVRAVGGDRVEAKSIITDPSADPHSYEASPEDALDVQDAQLLVYNGGGYDEFFGQLREQSPDTPAVTAFEISGKTEESHAEEHSHADEHAHGEEGHSHEHGLVNEHVWYDLPTVERVADQLATELGELDPASKQVFTGNVAAFKADIAGLEDRVAGIAESKPRTKALATEPVADYLLEAAGIADATPEDFARAIEAEGDVPVAAQQQVNQLIKSKQVQLVVNNAQTVTPVTENIAQSARAAGIPIVQVTETLPEGTNDYIAWMSNVVNDLAAALDAR
jgi:zinc/manganese transport system substrate-binding protein